MVIYEDYSFPENAVRYITVCSPGPDCPLCLKIIPKPDVDIKLDDVKQSLVKTLSISEKVYSSTIDIDRDHEGFDFELDKLCFAQISDDQATSTSNIGYILKAELDNVFSCYYAISCAHSIVKDELHLYQNVQQDPVLDQIPLGNIGFIYFSMNKVKPYVLESLKPQDINKASKGSIILPNRDHIDWKYVGAKFGLYLPNRHFPPYCNINQADEKVYVNADVGVVRCVDLPHGAVDNCHDYKPMSAYFTRSCLEGLNLPQERKYKLRMVSRCDNNCLIIRDFVDCEVEFFIHHNGNKIQMLKWNYRKIVSPNRDSECNLKPDFGDSGSPVFLINFNYDLPELLAGHFFADYYKDNIHFCLATRFDEALRLAKPLIFKDLLSLKSEEKQLEINEEEMLEGLNKGDEQIARNITERSLFTSYYSIYT